MRAARVKILLLAAVLVFVWMPGEGRCDVIRFKKGGAQQCVIVKETEKSIYFLSSMGKVTMAMEKVASIERDDDDVNVALEAKWDKKKRSRTAPKPKKVAPKPKGPPKPKPLRTHNIKITVRRILLGGRGLDLGGGDQVADFVIKDLGTVNGSRLFSVDVTSYKSAAHRIHGPSFHALSNNGLRFDPKPLKDYPELDATLTSHVPGSGYLAFPNAGKLEKLVLKSSLTDFVLDLETGKYSTKRGPF